MAGESALESLLARNCQDFIDHLKQDNARLKEENERLKREIEALLAERRIAKAPVMTPTMATPAPERNASVYAAAPRPVGRPLKNTIIVPEPPIKSYSSSSSTFQVFPPIKAGNWSFFVYRITSVQENFSQLVLPRSAFVPEILPLAACEESFTIRFPEQIRKDIIQWSTTVPKSEGGQMSINAKNFLKLGMRLVNALIKRSQNKKLSSDLKKVWIEELVMKLKDIIEKERGARPNQVNMPPSNEGPNENVPVQHAPVEQELLKRKLADPILPPAKKLDPNYPDASSSSSESDECSDVSHESFPDSFIGYNSDDGPWN